MKNIWPRVFVTFFLGVSFVLGVENQPHGFCCRRDMAADCVRPKKVYVQPCQNPCGCQDNAPIIRKDPPLQEWNRDVFTDCIKGGQDQIPRCKQVCAQKYKIIGRATVKSDPKACINAEYSISCYCTFKR